MCVRIRLAHAEQCFSSLCVRRLHKEVSDWNPSCPSHTLHGNRAQVHGLPLCTELLCFPLQSSLAQVDLTPLSHLDTTHPVTPHHAPCESLFHLSSLPSVAANGDVCYCQLIWPPLHHSVFSPLLAKKQCFCFAASLCSGFAISYVQFQNVQLWKKRRDCFQCSLLSLPEVWPWKENPPKIRSGLLESHNTHLHALTWSRWPTLTY